MEFKEIKRRYNINNEDISKFFGYKNKSSYQNSNKKGWIENGIVELFKKFKDAQ